MEFKNLVPAEFVWRDNRFAAAVRVNGVLSHAHIANSGRLPGIFEPGRQVWLLETSNKNRRTRYDLKLVENNGVLVSVDARTPNVLFKDALRNQALNGFEYGEVQQEVKLGRSRIDFRLSGSYGICWIETKSVTLVKDRVAMFPDAPTERGRKHLKELAGALKEGIRSSVVFIVQRSDADSFIPNWLIDPEFARIMVEVVCAGVEVKAYRCQVSLEGISIDNEIPVNINNTSEKFHV
jgi:sugar fermentation stimulation protein A